MNYFFTSLILIGLLFGCQKNKDGQLDELYKSANKNRIHGDFHEAVIEYSNLIDNDSTKGDYFFYRAICLTQIGEFNLAIPDFEKSIALNNKLSDCYYSMAVIYIYENPNENLANEYILKFAANNQDTESLLELSDAFIEKFINDPSESSTVL
jgi:tetratricopeptide (TPR) repeat protein